MDVLIELLGVIPELLLDLGLENERVLGLKQKDLDRYADGQGVAALSIRKRLTDMPPVQRKRLIRFTRVCFLLMLLSVLGVFFLTAILMENISGWFFLLGLAVEIMVFIVGYQAWKRKLMIMSQPM